MAPILRNTPKSYRSCILYEFQLGRSVEEAYNNFCSNTKNDNFYYVEFAYWFNRFSKGNADLDDESFDRKPRSFSDLPIEIVGEIVGELDLVSRLNTRHVSRFLRTVVDKQKTEYKKLHIKVYYDYILYDFDTHWNYYDKNECSISYRCSGKKVKLEGRNEDYVKIALNDLKVLMESPNLKIKLLELKFDCRAHNLSVKVVKFFKSLKTPILVKSLNVFYGKAEYVLPILSKLKPGTLETIKFGCVDTKMIANQLVKMDQWKQAKRVSIRENMPVGIKEFLHFNNFRALIESISTKDVLRLRDALTNSANFEQCHLKVEHNSSSIERLGKILGAEVLQQDSTASDSDSDSDWDWDSDSDYRHIAHRHPIPGSNEFLFFEIDSHEFSITRKH